jgi:cell division protease FtsH
LIDSANKVTFDNVAGADEEKEELKEVVEFMRNPKRFAEMGARIPKGVLLVGPPGTGKTLLAKAAAGEAEVPFYSISGSDFVEMFVGVGASRVRDLFNTAKKTAPAVVFIDEIDAVGRQRGAGLGGGHDEREQTLNQLLVEMDGFAPNEGIIVIAATNRPDILDPALLRPGRFDRQITVNYPDVKGREEILKVHAKNKPFEEDVDLSVLAKRTPGFTGADLENVLNEAAILAARFHKKKIGMKELEEAITRVVVGPEKKSRVITAEDKKITAYHESGHAIVAMKLPGCDPVHEVSIIPRGMAGGYTMTLPKEDMKHMTRGKLLDEIAMLLGGRVAETLALGDISTGAYNDLQRASDLARKMVVEYGMSEEIGPVFLGGKEEVFIAKDWGHQRNFSEEIAAKVDAEIKRILEEQFDRAKVCIGADMEALARTAKALIEYERVTGEEFGAIYEGKEVEISAFKTKPETKPETKPAAKTERKKSEDAPEKSE